MNFIGRFKLSKIIKDRPEAEPAISAWLKEQSQPFSEQSFIGGRRGPFWGSCSPFGKLHINYHINPPVRTGYIIYAGFDNKGIPPQVTMPEMEESLIRETISIVIGDGQRKETVVRKLVPNDMRDEDYPIPRAEVPLASQKNESSRSNRNQFRS